MKLLACFRPTYRVDIYIEYEQPRTLSLFVNACFLPSEIIALLLFFPLPFRFPLALFAGEGLKRQILRRHANNSLPRRFNIRAASRDSPLWNLVLFGTRPTLFPRFSRYYVSPPILGLPKMARDGRYGNSARRNPGCYCRTELTFRLSPTSRGDWS